MSTQHPPFSRRPLASAAAWLAAAALVLGGLALARSGRAAPGAQLSVPNQLIMPDPNVAGPAAAPQPVAVQALDATHFVVVTREPRLVSRVGEEGRAMNMILHVVTYYTVQNGRLIPIEHVHVPQGYRALAVGD